MRGLPKKAIKTEKTSPIKVKVEKVPSVKVKTEKNVKSEVKQDVSSSSPFPPPPLEFKKVKLEENSEPYPDFSRPAADEVEAVVELLSDIHGLPTPGLSSMTVLDSIVRTILSQNTTDKISRVAFMNLKKAFSSWKAVYDAYGTGEVEESIKTGGLSEMKARNIHNILAYLLHEHYARCLDGEPSYEWLRLESTSFIKRELLQHKGVGPKTVSCVLLFNLQRAEFPVDTHILHISKMLKWVPHAANADLTYLHLNCRVPDDLKYALHVLLVNHGKRCPRCAKGGRLQLEQQSATCPLTQLDSQVQTVRSGKRPPKSTIKEMHDLEGCENDCRDFVWGKKNVKPEKLPTMHIKEEPALVQEA
jgi:endonuclease III